MSTMIVDLMHDLEMQYKKQNIKTSMTWLLDEYAIHEIRNEANLGFETIHHESYQNQILGYKYKVMRNYQRNGDPLVALVPTSLLEGIGLELLLDNSKRNYENFYKQINKGK